MRCSRCSRRDVLKTWHAARAPIQLLVANLKLARVAGIIYAPKQLVTAPSELGRALRADKAARTGGHISSPHTRSASCTWKRRRACACLRPLDAATRREDECCRVGGHDARVFSAVGIFCCAGAFDPDALAPGCAYPPALWSPLSYGFSGPDMASHRRVPTRTKEVM